MRRDIFLTSGTTIECVIANIPENTEATLLAVYRGEVDPSVLTPETFLELESRMVANAVVQDDGTAHLTNLEPGTYTVIAVALDENPMDLQQRADAEAYLFQSPMASTVITVEDANQDQSVRLSF